MPQGQSPFDQIFAEVLRSRQSGGGAPGKDPLESLAQWSRRALIVLAAVLVIVLAACYWWFHPAINLGSVQVWTWIIAVAAIVAASLWVASLRSSRRRTLLRRLMVIPASVVAAFALGVLFGQPFIPGNAERYASVLQTTEGTFAEDIEEVDYSEVPVIDRESAILLGNRAMGSIPEYVSQFEIADTYSQINYRGRPVRVSPLAYADLFKWLSNRDTGIPAYVLVDMASQETQVVRLEQPIMVQLLIFSSEHEAIRQNILGEQDAGVTVIPIEQGYTRQEGKAILSVIPRRKLWRMREMITAVDPTAFWVISEVSEMRERQLRRRA